MIRGRAALGEQTFDLLVVGGGVYGLTIAYDAAQRGLSVALIERRDFGSGSSFNHARTIHGGLRYLQSLDVARSRESIRERRTLARIAPHAVKPMPFVLPLTDSLTKGPLAMRAGMALDAIVGRDRNDDVPESLWLPAGEVVSAEHAAARFPALGGQPCAGAAVWYDYVTTEADRLTLSWALAAARFGATLANYVEAVSLATDGSRVVGAEAIDRTDGSPLTISARIVVCACGSHVEKLFRPLGLRVHAPFLKAMNLVVARPADSAAIGGRTASGKTFFAVPYHDRTVFGTFESTTAVQPGDDGVDAPDVERFLAQLNEAFPALSLTADDVSLVHRGVVPAAANGNGTVSLEGHERVQDYAAKGIDGLISVLGTKYTTARGVAERVTDIIVARLKQRAAPCRTASTPLCGNGAGDVPAIVEAVARAHGGVLTAATNAHLVSSYGSGAGDVIALGGASDRWLTTVAKASPVIGAELIWAVRHEMVATLADAVIRRTPLGAVGHPGAEALVRAAALVGGELGWTAERREAEIRTVNAFYEINAKRTTTDVTEM